MSSDNEYRPNIYEALEDFLAQKGVPSDVLDENFVDDMIDPTIPLSKAQTNLLGRLAAPAHIIQHVPESVAVDTVKGRLPERSLLVWGQPRWGLLLSGDRG